MFSFFSLGRKKEVYPTLTSRLLAAIIDCTLVMIVLLPLQEIAFSLIFETPPSQELADIMQSSKENVYSFSQFFINLKESQAMKQFVDQGKFGILIGAQIFQLIALISIVLIFWIKYQSTPGKMLISAKIVDHVSEKKPTLTQYIIRMLSYSVSILPFFMGFFIVPFNKHRRALHDYIAGTRVVSTKKE